MCTHKALVLVPSMIAFDPHRYHVPGKGWLGAGTKRCAHSCEHLLTLQDIISKGWRIVGGTFCSSTCPTSLPKPQVQVGRMYPDDRPCFIARSAVLKKKNPKTPSARSAQKRGQRRFFVTIMILRPGSTTSRPNHCRRCIL